MEFQIGELYFMVWYPDEAKRYIVPDSIVFAGTNLLADDIGPDTWYFQDSDSYCAHGLYKAGAEPTAANVRLYRLKTEDLYQVVDSKGLADELARCAERRSR